MNHLDTSQLSSAMPQSPCLKHSQEVPEKESSITMKRYAWIDNARVIAALLIMYVHWRWRMDIPDSHGHDTLKHLFYFSNFYGAVPFFLIMAGYFLAKSITWKKAITRFFWLLVPFAIWNIIVYATARAAGEPQESIASIFGLGYIFSKSFIAIDSSATLPCIVPSWFLRDLILLSLLTPLLAKIKPILATGIIFYAACTGLNEPLHQNLILHSTTCIFYCLGVCLSKYDINKLTVLGENRHARVWFLLLAAASTYSIYSTSMQHSQPGTTLFGMLAGAAMIGYAGILIEKHLPRLSSLMAPCGSACFLVFMLHHPILFAIRKWVPAEIIDSYPGLLIPIPVFFLILAFFFGLKRYAPFLLPYLANMRVQPRQPSAKS